MWPTPSFYMARNIALEFGCFAAHHALPQAAQRTPEHLPQDLYVQGCKTGKNLVGFFPASGGLLLISFSNTLKTR
jgi:hypothetical protein